MNAISCTAEHSNCCQQKGRKFLKAFKIYIRPRSTFKHSPCLTTNRAVQNSEDHKWSLTKKRAKTNSSLIPVLPRSISVIWANLHWHSKEDGLCLQNASSQISLLMLHPVYKMLPYLKHSNLKHYLSIFSWENSQCDTFQKQATRERISCGNNS